MLIYLLQQIGSVAWLVNGRAVLHEKAQIAAKSFQNESTKSKSMPKGQIVLALPISELQKSSFEWLDDEDEFRYKGHLYDLENKVIIGDSIHITCYNDNEEEALFFAYTTMHENISHPYAISDCVQHGVNAILPPPVRIFPSSIVNTPTPKPFLFLRSAHLATNLQPPEVA
jgi:hypothetical protein